MTAQAASAHTSLQASEAATAGEYPFRGAVEALLRERKLDRTLTRSMPGAEPDGENAMPLDLTALDARLAGGLPRGQLSEVVGPASSGRTSVVCAWLGAATRRGEYVALVDTFDRFDPASGVACGMEMSRVLWVRGQAISKTAGAVDPAWLPGVRTVYGPGTLLERTIDRALEALNLILQSGVCTAVAIDLADVPAATLGRIPASTWLRVHRVIEGSETACVVLGPAPIARSAGGITINMGAQGAQGAQGASQSFDAPRTPWAPCAPRAPWARSISNGPSKGWSRARIAGR